ncbi:MAG: pentapeptide repeat-containing protein [Leptolyngbyaceae bacterium]|nr:pentapeptide repeat-containing protein [Leptolyngbyaceae bacterium]
MTTDPNSPQPHAAHSPFSEDDQTADSSPNGKGAQAESTLVRHSATLAINASSSPTEDRSDFDAADNPFSDAGRTGRLPLSLLTLVALGVLIAGFVLNIFWLSLAGSTVTLLLSVRIIWPTLQPILVELVSEQESSLLIGIVALLAAILGFLQLGGWRQRFVNWLGQANWDAVGALGEVFGALGQILIAVLAVYIAWRQYVISKDLTIQQNTITQQQTIDTYFQGVSDLVLDEEGLLEDWPQERSIAEGRTAAILSSVDAEGKAKIIRFLSRAKLLTPLKRDRRLGRAILDGSGGYEEDRLHGIRVIDLGVMLAGANLATTDLRWTDLSEINLIRANLNRCDLVKTNLSRTILLNAKLRGADLNGTRLFYGKAENASPRSRTEPPDYRTGVHTGAVVENADLTGVQQLSEEQRYYCCAWGGSKTRASIPGGCKGVPNKLGR